MPLDQPAPRVVVFAGPNGAGKSTHADAILAALGIPTFVNADYIARGLAGQRTETVAFAAGRIMLNRLHELAQAQADFAFESTLSSKSFHPFLLRLKAHGYHVAIYYFALSSSRLAQRRVKHRVALGGHDVPADVIKRRFGRSLQNFFQLYAGVADEWMVFDNSSGHTAQTVAHLTHGQQTIEDNALWRKLQTLARN
jgi:predicted ABC-type ATPase